VSFELANRKLQIAQLYFKEHQTAAQIARSLGISRTAVYNEINSAGKQVEVLLEAQISEIVRNSITALAAMAESIRADAEAEVDLLLVEGRQLDAIARKRQADINMYCELYDKAMPFIERYWERQALPMTLPPNPQGLLGEAVAGRATLDSTATSGAANANNGSSNGLVLEDDTKEETEV
jgi:predicted DNA-binding protein YlxM (UPF0122 family)